MVEPSVGAGSLDGIQRTRFLDHEDPGLVALGIHAILTQLAFGNVPALTAEREAVFDGANGVRQSQRIVSVGLEDMKGQALGGLLADAGKTNQLSNQA